jgi:hypothetical protein
MTRVRRTLDLGFMLCPKLHGPLGKRSLLTARQVFGTIVDIAAIRGR